VQHVSLLPALSNEGGAARRSPPLFGVHAVAGYGGGGLRPSLGRG
jgi:hypothetical protein